MVRDPEVKAKLVKLYRQAWSVYGRGADALARRDESTARIVRATKWQIDHLEEMPVLVVACLRGRFWRVASLTPIGASSFYGSIYPAIQNFLLAARALELGAALTTLPLWSTIHAAERSASPGTSCPAR